MTMGVGGGTTQERGGGRERKEWRGNWEEEIKRREEGRDKRKEQRAEEEEGRRDQREKRRNNHNNSHCKPQFPLCKWGQQYYWPTGMTVRTKEGAARALDCCLARGPRFQGKPVFAFPPPVPTALFPSGRPPAASPVEETGSGLGPAGGVLLQQPGLSPGE